MKKIVLIILLLITTGCFNNNISIDKETYKSYIDELKEIDTVNNEDIPFDINIYYDKIVDDEVVFRLILDNPKSEMNNIEAIVIHNSTTDDIFPSSGIFDTKYSLIPNTIDKENNIVEGIVLVGYISYTGNINDFKTECKALVKYIDEFDNEVKYYFIFD